ncbi:MAG: flavin reductase [Chloroflexi bacterium]|nr:MAG: flavin reductase [Chloroflexota bacterium]
MDSELFRSTMARHAAGVVVVSAGADKRWRGLTATTFTAISIEPPQVLVSLDRFAATRDAVLEAGIFNVSLLSSRQEFIAERFAGRAPQVDPSWREIPHRLGENGLPLVEGAIAWFECKLDAAHPAGDHDIVVGVVTSAGAGTGDPLILWDRSFWELRAR